MHVRASAVAVGVMAVGFTTAMVAPRLVAVGAALTIAGAVVGSMRADDRSWAMVVRSALLACATFGYPLFLGGRALPWVAFLAHLALLVAGWHASVAQRGRVATAQALAIALAVSLSAAATQFFFPSLWRWVATAAVAMFLILLCATVPGSIIHHTPAPAVAAMVLVLSEGLVILHQLPTHWVVNGAVVALGFAALLEGPRVPRLAFTSLLITVLLFGTFAGT